MHTRGTLEEQWRTRWHARRKPAPAHRRERLHLRSSGAHLATLRVHDREGLSPVPLPRKEPVPQLVVDLQSGQE